MNESYPGQTPEISDGEISFAGIVGQNAIFNVGSSNSPANHFRNMTLGVALKRSVVTVRSSKIYDIIDQSPTIEFGFRKGVGINCQRRTRLNQIGLGGTEMDEFSFSNNYWVDIFGEHSSITATQNHFDVNTQWAAIYRRWFSFLQPFRATDNYININGGLRGIWADRTVAASGIYTEIIGNTIDMHSVAGASGQPIVVEGENNPTDRAIISGNIVNFHSTDYNSGISVRAFGSHNNSIQQNIVNFYAGLSGNNGAGIIISVADGDGEQSVNFNNIQVFNDAFTQKGITASNAQNVFYCQNDVDGTDTGFHFSGNCLGTELRGNTIGAHERGLWIRSGAMIGDQSFTDDEGDIFGYGNQWEEEDSYSLWAADNEGVPEFSQFKVSSSSPPLMPEPRNPDGPEWFEDIAVSEIDCGIVPPIISGLDQKIADGSLWEETEEATEVDVWALERQLFRKMQNNLDAISIESDAFSFYNQKIGETVGIFQEAQNKINEALRISNEEQTELETLSNLVDDLAAEIRLLDENLSTDFEETNPNSIQSIAIQRNNKAVALGLAFEDMTDLMDILETERLEKLEIAKAFNLAINASKIYEKNEQLWNDVFIQKAINGGALEEEQLEILKYIALQCPQVGGNVVYKAIALLPTCEQQYYLDQLEENCLNNNDAVLSQSGIEHINIETPSFGDEVLTVFPNPVNNQLNINHPIENGTLLISNALGQTIKTVQLNQELSTTQINTSNWKSGIYYVTYQNNLNQQLQQKVVVIR